MRCLFLSSLVLLFLAIINLSPSPARGAESTTKPAEASRPLRLGNAGLRLGRPWAFTPDAKGIFTLRDSSIHLWDSATGKPTRAFSAGDAIMECTMSADGTTIAGWAGNRVHIWDVATGKQSASLTSAAGFAINPVLSNDGKTVAWINPNYKGIVIRDVQSGKLITSLDIEEKDGQPTNILLSPDGSTLADGGGGVVINNNIPKGFSTVRIWDVATKRLKLQARYDEGGIPALAFTPDSKRLVTSAGALRLWDVAAAKEVAKVAPDGSMRREITFAPDGKTLICVNTAATGAVSVERIDITGDQLKAVSSTPMLRPANVLSNDGRYAAYGNSAANIIETETGKAFGIDVGPTSNTKFAAFVNGGTRVLTVTEDGTAFLWEAATGTLLKRYDMQTPRVVSASVSPDGATVVLTDDMCINGFDMNAGNQLYSSRPAIGRRVTLAAISPDGKRVAATGRLFDMQMNSGLFVWNSQVGGAPKVERAVPSFHVSGICWSPDGSSIAVGCADETARLYSSETGAEQTTFRLPNQPVLPAPVAANRMIRRSSEKSIVAIDFSPDGRILAATLFNGDLVLWESPSGKFVRQYSKLDSSPARVRFDPRGFAIATLTFTGKITFWEAATGVKIAGLQPGKQIDAWNFSPDGQWLVVAGDPADNAIWKSPLSDPAKINTNLPDPDNQHLEKLWADLADRDASRAFQSARLFTAEGKPALKFLAGHLKWPPPSPEARTKILALIHDLSADEFKTRRGAERQLREMNGAARPLLIETLKNPESIDSRLAMERLLNEDPPAGDVSPEDARYLRAIAALEQIGGQETIDVLQTIWDTSTSNRAAAEARASLARLKAKGAVSPNS